MLILCGEIQLRYVISWIPLDFLGLKDLKKILKSQKMLAIGQINMNAENLQYNLGTPERIFARGALY